MASRHASSVRDVMSGFLMFRRIYRLFCRLTFGLPMHKILLLTRYDRLCASSRVRFLQFLPALAAQGFDFDVRPFFGDEYVRALYSGKKMSIASVATSLSLIHISEPT